MPNPRTRNEYMNSHKSNQGRTTAGSKTNQKAAERAIVIRKAAQLRASGATFREIGEALDIDPTTAQTWVWKAVKEAANETAEIMRATEGARLDRLQRGIWAQAVAGDTKAVATVLRIMERRAKLFGLDMPVRIEVAEVVPEASDVDAELAVIMGMLADDDAPAAIESAEGT